MKEYLVALRQTIEFQNLIAWLKKQSPQVPRHSTSPDNTETWKAQSHERDGFELAVSLLTGEAKNE
ncbi:MAG: hypothetical protein E4G91_09300 [Candidatus Zixiibacteriota bacterium]|nr:MAG: hypothetical protein E4G91_09300 [candidate division Zixibacteria bacterium]